MVRRTGHRLAAAAMVLTVIVVGACRGDADPPTDTTLPGIANPASEFCVGAGGTVEIVDEAEGQVGYCILPDGSRIEEWEYFRDQTGSTIQP